MPISISDPQELRGLLARLADAEAFDSVRVTTARLPPEISERLKSFVDASYHGDMGWLAETAQRRATPDAMWPEAKSAVIFSLSYAPDFDPMTRLAQRSSGVISVYALNRDYHDIVKGKLKRVAQRFAHASNATVKVFVDTAPLMEKPLAAQAGAGWQGKHTNLVSRTLGSWFFLGVMLTDCELTPDPAETDHCGSCSACLQICPTQAFPRAGVLDARRCISYLTIEHKGHIAHELRAKMGNHIYGCDDCLAVCPWNKFAVSARDAKLQARADLLAPDLAMLLRLDDAQFRALFSGSPVKRIGRDRFIRNCLIAAGNSGDALLVTQVKALLRDPSPLVRAAAAWALAQLLDDAEFSRIRDTHVPLETDGEVQLEWETA